MRADGTEAGPDLGFLGTVINPRHKAVAPELHAALPRGVTLHAYPSRVPVFPSTPVERALQTLGHLEAGLRAAGDGCRALVIDSVGDYGLDALRAAVCIPVVGAGEAGMAAAAAGGRRFAIVTVWPASMNFIVEDLLHAYGHEPQSLGIWNVGLESDITHVAGPDGYLERIRRAEEAILAKVMHAIDAAARSGAEAVLLGCTCMSPMADRVAARATLPVVNPLKEGALRALAFAAGDVPSNPVRTSRGGLVEKMVDAVADEEREDCPVCVVGEAFA